METSGRVKMQALEYQEISLDFLEKLDIQKFK